ncbi:hypothetical protein D9757_001107 [Collybiopsis confluens]|uniref:Uncharacterized protein n=1 Tax=Collybiopsis confluens TaxID=2823264 RepID=A0A8H5I0S8_9AGAR|nr:hypothetical protein D9757_001107 [Collybiopsis confluens]
MDKALYERFVLLLHVKFVFWIMSLSFVYELEIAPPRSIAPNDVHTAAVRYGLARGNLRSMYESNANYRLRMENKQAD